jgi:hypothetical protein
LFHGACCGACEKIPYKKVAENSVKTRESPGIPRKAEKEMPSAPADGSIGLGFLFVELRRHFLECKPPNFFETADFFF